MTDQYDTPEFEHGDRDDYEIAQATDERRFDSDDAEDDVREQDVQAHEYQEDSFATDLPREFGAGKFVPVTDDADWEPQQLPDWKSVDFREPVQVGAADGDQDGESLHDLVSIPGEAASSEFVPGDVDASAESRETPTRSKMLAKLWGFARAFRGATDANSARHNRR